MTRQKKRRFEENKLRPNLVESGKDFYDEIKGKWHLKVFTDQQPIVLELGCGKGEYTLGLAQAFPNRNHIGVDIKGDRLWVGSGIALREGIQNAAFLRTQIQFLEHFFKKGEIEEIWVTFPDPRPKEKDDKRRLTAPRFLAIYQNLLKPDGWLKFKTDNTELFNYTLELINKNRISVKNLAFTHDLYNSEYVFEHYEIKTKYERKFAALGETIKYLKFQFQ
ncbi:MAG: tRNA (guanosine(46)-N7)-methyltransferase TrmB [Cyclobacteriaceae bacterium]|nr:tRNA (guanosine(46)-N7)-methyltransferase TrmB [Cyclobacteriaceae bacterium]MDC6484162.1 tRNA (guanosine(46)-N7)-methyltransferase TrmB [Cyclobacteriaceae bacterium]